MATVGTVRNGRRVYPPQPYQNAQMQNGQPQQNQNQNQNQPGPSNQNPPQAPQTQNQNADAQSATNSNGAGGPGEMNLAGVLHYLQSEWRRWERDRNEWEIERAEMRARIALLEGQRRSAENLKGDLLRRVKMLEFALKQERTKTVGAVPPVNWKLSAVAPSRLSVLQDEDNRSEKEGSTSSSEDGVLDRPKTNGTHPQAAGNTSSAMTKYSDTNTWKHLGGGVPRDPKSRAKSREYLKQCLQEITYLTSPGALNPLPARSPIDLPESSEPPVAPHPADLAPAASTVPVPQVRPIKALPERAIASTFNKSPPIPETTPPSAPEPPVQQHIPNGVSREVESAPIHPEPETREKAETSSHAMAIEQTARPPSSPAPKKMSLPDEPEDAPSEVAGEGEEVVPAEEEEEKQILTAIYRPDSSAAWREELRAANEKAERARAGQDRLKSSQQSDEEQLANLIFSIPAEDEEIKSETDDNAPPQWFARRSMKSMDVIRTVASTPAEGGSGDMLVVSAGDDCVVSVWKIDKASISASRPKSSSSDLEPIQIYRGHTAPITSLLITSPTPSCSSEIISSSLDSTIRIYTLPPSSHNLYAPYDSTTQVQILESHTEAVWDFIQVGEGRFISASSDGSIKLWIKEDGVGEGQYRLFKSRLVKDLIGEAEMEGVIPVCLGYEEESVFVGLSSGLVVAVGAGDLDVKGEKRSWGTSSDVQVNSLVVVPELRWIVGGYEDGYIRIHDLDKPSEEPLHTILAHPSPITSIALSPTHPKHVFTSSTDCTIRLWDLTTLDSILELGGHRKRGDEGVTKVIASEEGVLFSAGGDGIVKVWVGV